MADSRGIEIAPAATDELAALRSFYESVGYGAELDAADRILVARRARTIVAAVRLSRESDTLVLRGMYVAEALRGAGIGSRLLARTSDEIGLSACWCVPYTSLQSFYSRIGFRVRTDDEVPEFLVARERRYAAAGHEVTIMGRSEGWAAGAVD